MRVWVEFSCIRCDERHRLAFDIVAYPHFMAQHATCGQGWQPKNNAVCIHDYAIRQGKPAPRTRQWQWRNNAIYAPPDITMPEIKTYITDYIMEHYPVDKGKSVDVKVDFQ